MTAQRARVKLAPGLAFWQSRAAASPAVVWKQAAASAAVVWKALALERACLALLLQMEASHGSATVGLRCLLAVARYLWTSAATFSRTVVARQGLPGRSRPWVPAVATHYWRWTPVEGPVPLRNQPTSHGSHREGTLASVMVMTSRSVLGERLPEESALGLEPVVLATWVPLLATLSCPAVQQQK